MPLIRSKSPEALHENMRTLTADIGKSPHVQSRAQAIAIAMETQRRAAHKASGGVTSPFGERMAARQMFHEGFLHSSVPGRTDKLPITVEGGAYVVPSSHVAMVGQDNSVAGAHILDKMFGQGVYGTHQSPIHAANPHVPHLNLQPKMPHMTSGGIPKGKPTQIIAAGGEYIVSPSALIRKYGSLDKAHKIMDHWIVTGRKKHAKTIANLAPPKKN